MEGNDNLCTFLKRHYLCSRNLRKDQILIYPRTMNVLSCRELNSQIFYIIDTVTFNEFD